MSPSACCNQGGNYICNAGESDDWPCNAECSLSFIPFWDECITTAHLGDVHTEMHDFQKLYQRCTHLGIEDVALLVREASDLQDSATCSINTAAILSTADVTEPCPTDASDTTLCQNLIASGAKNCEEDYCPSCPEARSCDHTCLYSCLDMNLAPPPPPPAAEACSTNEAAFCEMVISNSVYTCDDDYCLTCPQAHQCDHTCGLPCGQRAGGGGNRRALVEAAPPEPYIVPFLALNVDVCPFATFGTRLELVTAACCGNSTGACEGAVPDTCSFDCGRVYTRFTRDCDALLTNVRRRAPCAWQLAPASVLRCAAFCGRRV
eukprot:SAG11_NODE_3567_length_2367_cov_1.810847_1_plen_320_part_00